MVKFYFIWVYFSDVSVMTVKFYQRSKQNYNKKIPLDNS